RPRGSWDDRGHLIQEVVGTYPERSGNPVRRRREDRFFVRILLARWTARAGEQLAHLTLGGRRQALPRFDFFLELLGGGLGFPVGEPRFTPFRHAKALSVPCVVGGDLRPSGPACAPVDHLAQLGLRQFAPRLQLDV